MEYFAYLNKTQTEMREKAENADYTAWIQGKYIEKALTAVYPLFNFGVDAKKTPKYPYPEKPFFELAKEEKEKKQKAELFAQKQKEIDAHNAKIQSLMQNRHI